MKVYPKYPCTTTDRPYQDDAFDAFALQRNHEIREQVLDIVVTIAKHDTKGATEQIRRLVKSVSCEQRQAQGKYEITCDAEKLYSKIRQTLEEFLPSCPYFRQVSEAADPDKVNWERFREHFAEEPQPIDGVIPMSSLERTWNIITLLPKHNDKPICRPYFSVTDATCPDTTVAPDSPSYFRNDYSKGCPCFCVDKEAFDTCRTNTNPRIVSVRCPYKLLMRERKEGSS